MKAPVNTLGLDNVIQPGSSLSSIENLVDGIFAVPGNRFFDLFSQCRFCLLIVLSSWSSPTLIVLGPIITVLAREIVVFLLVDGPISAPHFKAHFVRRDQKGSKRSLFYRFLFLKIAQSHICHRHAMTHSGQCL